MSVEAITDFLPALPKPARQEPLWWLQQPESHLPETLTPPRTLTEAKMAIAQFATDIDYTHTRIALAGDELTLTRLKRLHEPQERLLEFLTSPSSLVTLDVYGDVFIARDYDMVEQGRLAVLFDVGNYIAALGGDFEPFLADDDSDCYDSAHIARFEDPDLQPEGYELLAVTHALAEFAAPGTLAKNILEERLFFLVDSAKPPAHFTSFAEMLRSTEPACVNYFVHAKRPKQLARSGLR